MYRFFELFDLRNVPKVELLQYMAKKNKVVVTPPFKAYLEEKLLFALYHHPVLRPFWTSSLPATAVTHLDEVLPRTWVVDLIPGLTVAGVPLTHWLQLAKTTKRERAYVLKPSGFSALAWGSKGVAFGPNLSTPDWEAALRAAMDSFAAPGGRVRYDVALPYPHSHALSCALKHARTGTQMHRHTLPHRHTHADSYIPPLAHHSRHRHNHSHCHNHRRTC